MEKSLSKFTAIMYSTGAAMAVLVPMHGSNLHAQTDPVLDICTGISVNQSDVSNLLKAVNNPIVTPIQGKINSLLGVLGALPLSLPSTLSVNVDGIVDTAISGNPIGLSVLDTDGNVIAPGNCNVTTDGYTLNTEAGLAIGGNQITGLGQNGLTANAGTLDSIALGNNASTDAGAAGAIAIGSGASVTAGNSVALGTGSLADRGALTGYTAPGLSGTYNSVGSLSVGSTGNLRQITNVAPGTLASDAATVGQVQGALDAVAALDTAAVQYDDASKGTVTLGGASGTLVTNVSAGTLSNTSSDAVNGSQLFATNQTVLANTSAIAGNTSAIAAIDTRVSNAETQLTSIDGRVTTNTSNIAGNTTAINALDTRVTSTETQLTNIDGRVTTNTSDIAALDTRVSNNETQLTSIDGRVTTNTSDIAALDTRVSNNETQLTSIDGRVTTNTSDIAALDTRVSNNETQLTSIDGRVTTNTSNIAGNTTAINALDTRVISTETQLTNIDGRVTINTGDIANLTTTVASQTTSITNLDNRLTTTETTVGGIDTRVTSNTTAISNLQAQAALAPIGYVADGNKTTPSSVATGTVALIGATSAAVTLTHVADGTLATGSTDAVNGGQLAASNARIAANETAIADNRIAISQNTSSIQNIANNLSGNTVSAAQYSNPDAPTHSNGGTVTNDVTLVGAVDSTPVALHNVAAASAATDAVNLGQMQAGMEMLRTSMAGYVESRLADVRFDLDEVQRDAHAGTAGAMAFAGIPQTTESGRSMLAGAVSHYRGATAFAMGFSTSFEKGPVVKVGASVDSRGYTGVTAGAGVSF